MKIGFVGPIDTQLLAQKQGLEVDLPQACSIPMNSLLVSAFLEMGHEVVVFSLSDEVDGPNRWDFGPLTVHLGRFRKHRRARDFFKVERADLRLAMESESFDVLNAHWTYEYALAALSVDRDALISARDWAPAILMQMPDPYRLIRLAMAMQVYWKGRHFTVNSPYMKQVFDRWTGNTAQLIPNGLDDASFHQVARWKSEREPRTLIAINRGFLKRKNMPVLLRAFAKLRVDEPTLRLKLIGYESEVDGVGYRWAVEHQLTEGIDFLGHLNYAEAQQHLQGASVLVHPSLEESFGMVLIEAMARGVPVVAGAQSGAVPWVLDGGLAGVLVDVSDPDALAGAIRVALSNESTWQRYSDSGYSHAKDAFRISSVAERYLKIYEEIISERA